MKPIKILVVAMVIMTAAVGNGWGADDALARVKASGVLRHLGVPYANFVTGSGDGMDVELMQQFARHLGVRYEYVATDWANVIPDLIGRKIQTKGDEVIAIGPHPVRGDVIANGLTVLSWRQKVLDYSTPTFPTQVWLIASADSTLQPITPSGTLDKDIATVKSLLKGRMVLVKSNTCLDPSLYNLAAQGIGTKLFDGGLNELAPAVIQQESETTLLDVPDALVALEKWPGQVKVIGPVSDQQHMAVGFAKGASGLKQAFDAFLDRAKRDGTFIQLVNKYYPSVFRYYPDFFKVSW